MSSSQQFCDQCGTANRSQARFCTICGASLGMIYSGKTTIHNSSTTLTGRLNADTLLGQRYRIKHQLGQGGMGAVYLAEDTRFGIAYRAVKELSQHGLSQHELQDAETAFEQEAMLLANLLHPHLPRIYDHFLEDGRWYLVMDYIEGETLESRLSKIPNGDSFGIDKTLHVALQLCDVLSYLHSRQPPIIFRDLKPDNIMLTPDNHVYLIDFGIARVFKPGQAFDTITLGSPGYAAPEQYGKAQTTAAADIFSLGATLHHMLTNHDPSDSPFQFAQLQLGHQLTDLDLATLVMEMVNINKNLRPVSTQIIKQRLQSILDQRTNKAAITSTTTAQRTATSKAATTAGKPSPRKRSHTGKATIVDRSGNGDYTTITTALRNVQENERILVRPGIYNERLILDKAVEIIGDGPKEHIIVESSDTNCLSMQTNFASVQGLTLRSRTGQYNKKCFGVDISQGQLILEDCDITSDSLSCITIHNFAANPIIRRCRLFNSKQNGVFVHNQGRGFIEECEIFGNELSGIEIKDGASPLIRDCSIHDSKQSGIFVHDQGKGTIKQCDIFGNGLSGIEIKDSSDPIVRDCTLHDDKQNGVYVHKQGNGTIEQCDIFGNGLSGIEIKDSANPLIRGCIIKKNKRHAIYAHNKAKGFVENSDLRDNGLKATDVTSDSHTRFINNQQ